MSMKKDEVIWEFISDEESSDGPIFIEDYQVESEKQYILNKKSNYKTICEETSIVKKEKPKKSILNCIKNLFINIILFGSFILKILF